MLRQEFVRYVLVGGAGTLVHLLVMVLSIELGELTVVWGSALGFLCALLLSFVLNYRWTFGSVRSPLSTLARYVLVSVSGLLLNVLMVTGLVGLLDIWYLTAQLAVIWVVPVVNFMLNRYWTF